MKFLILSVFLLHFSGHINGQGEECVTADRTRGVCQVLPNCPSLIQLYSANRGNPLIINYLITSQKNCGNRNLNRNPVVCCGTNNAQPPQPTTQPPPPPPPTTQAPRTTQRNPLTDSNCKDPAGNSGVCVNIKECQPVLNDFLARQNDPNYVRYIQQSNANCNYVQPNICCPKSMMTVTTAPPVIPTSPTSRPIQPSGPIHLLTPEEGCGFSNKTHNRVVGGVDAELGGWPWMALLGYKNNLGEIGFKCGGSIITRRHVLTAAHCMRPTLSVARLGEHNLDIDTETKHYDIPVEKTVKHPQYDPKDGNSDVAVVTLQSDIPFTDTIRPVCIPIEPPVLTRNFEGYSPFVAGWGRTQEGGKSASILQELQLPILKNEECMEKYRDVRKLISDKQFNDAVLCAGFLQGGKDSCQGDSGGPLMIPVRVGGSFIYYQIGIVSYGIGCARASIPGVYTRVQTFSDWIREQVSNSV
uniref:CLIP domain-containing serine protease n=1 Tax=Lutzomyia longipalpis TaxID=7200 RepID=A0A1B0CAP3_LUTLO